MESDDSNRCKFYLKNFFVDMRWNKLERLDLVNFSQASLNLWVSLCGYSKGLTLVDVVLAANISLSWRNCYCQTHQLILV